jgi:hypothetical protein
MEPQSLDVRKHNAHTPSINILRVSSRTYKLIVHFHPTTHFLTPPPHSFFHATAIIVKRHDETTRHIPLDMAPSGVGK